MHQDRQGAQLLGAKPFTSVSLFSLISICRAANSRQTFRMNRIL